MPPYADDTDLEASDLWESHLIREVCSAVKEIWTSAGKPSHVYLAIDGVVPMAKIRQQRVRRFKSAWIRRQYGGTMNAWDSNSITPGTAFLENLSRELKKIAKTVHWKLSDATEPGEGEHKIMEWLRKTTLPEGDILVYGLDADLILLCMLVQGQCNRSIWLMREEQEFGTNKKRAREEGEREGFVYQYLGLQQFQSRLGLHSWNETVNYVGIMSFMGNDFLPHSLTHKLNDDGHECVMQVFRTLQSTNRWLIENDTVQIPVLLEIFAKWSTEEEDRMKHMIEEKQKAASRGLGKGMEVYEGLAFEWAVERELLEGRSLKPSWKEAYWSFVHPCVNLDDKLWYCEEYIRGFQWILDYYLGTKERPSMTWMYPSWLPPLWSDFLAVSKTMSLSIPISLDQPIQPQEQLAMVLPLESWGLVRNPALRSLPLLAPQLWPSHFTFLSLGRRFFWECEARIPVLTAARIRNILTSQE